ncbi:LacI family DNA-binding transcriptional regulator [Rathayibacter festucae]|uniref:LacI family DNA-binding transcriptional regulator n=1 Tax=Rathayibacter festucae TaxID=110937 RepID=UPI002A6A81CC|nr:LacI family DNA-binding transcriptional regulator [Rathayibacter festucae]MDY0914553.1 LacI family DNA-binding transcriptional regulator [Rathayibacter festucae]
MIVKMSDVARQAGVSEKTVSNALNGHPSMRQETRRRVLETAERLGYIRNDSARALRSGRSRTIGLVLPELRNPFFAELADAIMDNAESRGYKVVIHQSKGSRERELESLRRGALGALDGILLHALALGDADTDRIVGGLPLVLLGDRFSGTPADHVTMANADAARTMTDHLIDRGHRRIAVVGAHRGDHTSSAGLRLQGHREALLRHGIEYDEDLIRYTDGWHRLDGVESTAALLESGTDFDAVFALNDMLALGAMSTLRARGITVPEDVSVVGFDDIEEARYTLPALTTIDPGTATIARASVERLLARIAGDSSRPERLKSPFTIQLRGSSR